MRKRTFIIVIIMVLSILIVFNSLNRINKSLAASDNSLENRYRSMLIDTADAYYRKKKYYQYDLYRENKYLAPESINQYNYSYSVCSTFAFQIYYNTLGIVIPFKSSNIITNSNYAIDNNVSSDFFNRFIIGENGSLNDFINEAYDYVLPGDLIVFKIGNNGHTTMVYKKEIVNGEKRIKIIHNNGYVYDHNELKDKIEESGSLYKDDLKEFLNKNSTLKIIHMVKVIKTKSDVVKYLVFKTNNDGTKTIIENEVKSVSDKASSVRYKYKSMDLTKTHKIIKDDCSTSTSLYADLNDYIEYTIEIKNNSDSNYTNMKFVEKIDTSKVDFISSSGTFDSSMSTITFKDVKVESNSSKKLTYKVRVKNDNNLLGKKIESNGTLDGKLNTKKIVTYIGGTLSKYSQDLLKSQYKNISVDSSDTSGKKYVKKLYKDLLGYDLDIKDTIIAFDNNVSTPVNNTKITNNKDIVVGNLYGLSVKDSISVYKAWGYQTSTGAVNIVASTFNEYENRPRTLTKDMFETGDIIYTNNVAYIYIDGALIKNKEVYYEKKIGIFLNNLVGKNYVVLRPSLSKKINRKTYKIEYKTNESNVTNLPQTTSYTYSTVDKCKTNISKDIPKRRGYTFAGWEMIRNDNSTIVWNSGTAWLQSNAKDYTLYTTWKANQYKITYDLNGAKGSIEPTIYSYNEEGATTITSVVPKRDNYVFSGWSRNKNDSVGSYSPSTRWKLSNASNYTLYAIWVSDTGEVIDTPVNDPDKPVEVPETPDNPGKKPNNPSKPSKENNESTNNDPIENDDTKVDITDDIIENRVVSNNKGKDYIIILIVILAIIPLILYFIKRSKNK